MMQADITFEIIINMNNIIRSLMGKLIGKAKFIINAGLNELNEHNKNKASLKCSDESLTNNNDKSDNTNNNKIGNNHEQINSVNSKRHNNKVEQCSSPNNNNMNHNNLNNMLNSNREITSSIINSSPIL